MAASWSLLDERSELELHKARLLNVEEKPFKRISKRLSTVSSTIARATHTQDAERIEDSSSNDNNTASSQTLKEDLTHDFAAFDSSIARLQFLHDANRRERERYADDQQRILGECQTVRKSNGQLRQQLDAARATLAQRKKFDELADKITSNRLLRPREDQLAALEKLEEECKQLERESETYKETWQERRDQFNRIMDEGMMLRRQIRDEKEEVDRREGMNEEGEAEEEAEANQTPKPSASDNATPRPDGETTPAPAKTDNDNEAGDTPQVEGEPSAARTPLGGTPAPEKAGSTNVPAGSSSQHLQVPDARAKPAQQTEQEVMDTGEDVEMDDQEGATQQKDGNDNEMQVDEDE